MAFTDLVAPREPVESLMRRIADRWNGRPRIAMVDDWLPYGDPAGYAHLPVHERPIPKGPQLMALLIMEAGGEPIHIRRHVADAALKAIPGMTDSECAYISTHDRFSSEAAKAAYGPALDALKANILREAERRLEEADGIVLLGNYNDLPPPSGKTPHPKMVRAPLRDMRYPVERLMWRFSKSKQLPTFGICGGMELMLDEEGCDRELHLPDCGNALAHETGIKDVEDYFRARIAAVGSGEETVLPETVGITRVKVVDPDSILCDTLSRSSAGFVTPGCGNISFNAICRHHEGFFPHQAMAPGIRITALASDNVVEGIELDEAIHRCAFGLQNHPELDALGKALTNVIVGMAAAPGISYKAWRAVDDARKHVSTTRRAR